MRFYKPGLVSPTVFLTYFIFGPLENDAVDTCLSPDWRDTEICKDMGLVYPSYPNSLESIAKFRTKLIDPDTVVWFRAGSGQCFKLTHVITVHRNSSFGTSFEAHREPGGKGRDPEFFHVWLNPPPVILRVGSSQNSGSKPIAHLTKIAYSNRVTDVSHARLPLPPQRLI